MIKIVDPIYITVLTHVDNVSILKLFYAKAPRLVLLIFTTTERCLLVLLPTYHILTTLQYTFYIDLLFIIFHVPILSYCDISLPHF